MKRDLYRDLSWLPPCPADFNRRCHAAIESKENFGENVRRLASFALDDNQLLRLEEMIAAAAGHSLAPLQPFRLGIAGNGTSDFIRKAIIATGARHGLALNCIATGHDQVLQDSFSIDSPLNRFTPDAVLVALDWRSLPLLPTPGDAIAAQTAIESTLDRLDSIRDAIHRHSGAVSIVQNLAAPPERTFGSLDRRLQGTLWQLIDGVNTGLAERLRSSTDVLLDVAGLAETVGLAYWHSPSEWNLAKLPFSQAFLPLYADHVCRVLAALRGMSRRCLILDLDNTLWGGLVGDDGLKGIRIGQGDAAGEAYLSFQQHVLFLRKRGVVLAVSSKNEDETARGPFREHPDMLLREQDFSVFQANWQDKASNIQAIADILGLGLDTIVFVDDSPFERSLVRNALPSIAIPEMPDDPADYARTLSAAGYFEAVAFSDEDTKRASYYAGNAERARLERQVGDIPAYLASLEMEIDFRPFNESSRSRITQLINKSNQFNLTTRRYTEAEVEALETDPEALTLQARLRDKFGDNGMISVVICRCGYSGVWEIDTWLMSCRVLGRRVEEAVLGELLDHARRRGASWLRGIYRPTDRNKLVEGHYLKLGFVLVDTRDDGSTVWDLEVASAYVQPTPMVVRRIGFETVPSPVPWTNKGSPQRKVS
ncbi:MAG TPA: HAD-IIIC family phosphatase [Candidatus Binatia bacterium]|nr:HAD-IIIC family phosphatase [Candidatus Binatia bacterium]